MHHLVGGGGGGGDGASARGGGGNVRESLGFLRDSSVELKLLFKIESITLNKQTNTLPEGP